MIAIADGGRLKPREGVGHRRSAGNRFRRYQSYEEITHFAGHSERGRLNERHYFKRHRLGLIVGIVDDAAVAGKERDAEAESNRLLRRRIERIDAIETAAFD